MLVRERRRSADPPAERHRIDPQAVLVGFWCFGLTAKESLVVGQGLVSSRTTKHQNSFNCRYFAARAHLRSAWLSQSSTQRLGREWATECQA